jgi:membrane protein
MSDEESIRSCHNVGMKRKLKPKELFHKIGYYGKWIFAINRENDILVYSGHACLLIVVASFPFLTLIVSLLNNMPSYEPEDLIDAICRILPDLPVIRSTITRMIYNLKAQSSAFVTGLSLILTLWFSTSGVSAIQAGLKRVTLESDKNKWDKPIAMAYTLVFIVALPAFLVFNVFSQSIMDAEESLASALGITSSNSQLLQFFRISSLISMAAAFLIILLTYTYLPGGKRRKIRRQVPGALVCTVVWFLVSAIFSWMIPKFYRGSVLYGSLAALFLVIMWLRIMLYVLYTCQVLNTVLYLHANMYETGVKEE